MSDDTPDFGPIQMLVLGFDDPAFTGTILPELARLKENDIIRLVDLLVVKKDVGGDVELLQHTDLSQEDAETFGALVGALIGLGTGDEDVAEAAALAGAEALEDGHVFDDADVWYVTDAIPEGKAAAIALIEHRWAIPLRNSVVAAGGFVLADEWIHPKDLIAVGAAAALLATSD
jgi:Predicted membrane protein